LQVKQNKECKSSRPQKSAKQVTRLNTGSGKTVRNRAEKSTSTKSSNTKSSNKRIDADSEKNRNANQKAGNGSVHAWEAANEPVYMATMLIGLEPVAADEIQSKIRDAQIKETGRGKVFFASKQPVETLTTLRSIDNLYIWIASFAIGPHKIHLHDLEKQMETIDLSKAVPEPLTGRPVTFTVNSSRAGKHTYSRFDLSDAAARGLLKQRPDWALGTPEDHMLEFRLDVQHEQAIFSCRLTSAEFRFRGERLFSRAALRPTIAHALVWLSNPQAGDWFLDPFCGSGTIVAERAFYPYAQIYGSDVSAEAVEAAKQNMPDLPGISIHQWDARELPLDAGSIDTVVSNLPFGEQILTPEEIDDLYLRWIRQLKRIVKPNGTAIVLTTKVEELQKAADRFSLDCYELMGLSLKGLHPSICKLQF
jgi:23S rRNA G2445 N2-methylase RlmL